MVKMGGAEGAANARATVRIATQKKGKKEEGKKKTALVVVRTTGPAGVPQGVLLVREIAVVLLEGQPFRPVLTPRADLGLADVASVAVKGAAAALLPVFDHL